MNDVSDTLMLALAHYEMDEPHWNEREGEGWYAPKVTMANLREWLASEHDGDCTGQPQTCVRCLAEGWKHKAAWLASALAATQPPPEAKEDTP